MSLIEDEVIHVQEVSTFNKEHGEKTTNIAVGGYIMKQEMTGTEYTQSPKPLHEHPMTPSHFYIVAVSMLAQRSCFSILH